MTRLRILIYAHCLVASACVVFTYLALVGLLEKVWPFEAELREVAHSPVGACIGCLWLLSCFLFPAFIVDLVSYRTKVQMTEWRRWVVVYEDALLGIVQLASFTILISVRYY